MSRDEANVFLTPADLYRQLRAVFGKKFEAQGLERALFLEIITCEEAIHQAKEAGERGSEARLRRRRARLKRVADGLAWMYFGDNQFGVKMFAVHPAPGFMFGKKGVSAEREQLDMIKELNFIDFVIQNDITNILRSGDLTFRAGAIVQPIEVKSGAGGFLTDRAKRQTERREALLEYIETGTTNHESLLTGKGSPRQHIHVPGTRGYYWATLNQLFEGASELGRNWRVADDGVILIGWHGITAEEAINYSMPEIMSQSGWVRPQIMMSQLSEQLKALENDILRFAMPVTAFEVQEAVVADLLDGVFDMCMLVDINRVAKLFADRGYSAECDGGRWKVSAGGDWAIEGTLVSWNRVLYELESIPSFVDTTIAAFEAGVARAESEK
jgi:hypothetical protein